MKIFKLIEIQKLFRIPILNIILCLGCLGISINLSSSEEVISVSPYSNYTNKELIAFATENPKLLKVLKDGILPLHEALNFYNWELAKAYAQLAPETLLVKFADINYFPLDFVLNSKNYELASEFIKINPETARYFNKENISPIRFLNSEKKDFANLKQYPALGTLLKLATRPQASKYNPDIGGAISAFKYILDQVSFLRENNNYELNLRLKSSHLYATNLEVLTEIFPNEIEAKNWNPKFQLIFLETYLHIVNAFEDLNSIYARDEFYTLEFYRAYNSFLSQLFNNIALSNHEIISYDTPNILHLLHNQLRITLKYSEEYSGDESTLRWSYVHTILFDLLSKMSKSEVFGAATKEFEKKFAKNPTEFNKSVEALSRDYIKKLADYKIDYRSLEK